MKAFLKLLKSAPLTAKVGLFIIVLNILLGVFAPVISPYGETELVGSEFEPPSEQFILGTDNLGRDMFTRMNYGARNTIGIAFLTTVLAFMLGSIMGLLAATSGRLVRPAVQPRGRYPDVNSNTDLPLDGAWQSSEPTYPMWWDPSRYSIPRRSID